MLTDIPAFSFEIIAVEQKTVIVSISGSNISIESK